MEGFRTKSGYVMNRTLRARIVIIMAESRGLTLKSVADQLGIARRTLGDYLTKDVRAEIEARRAADTSISVDDVDKAMMAQACAGNVAAARLVYMRMAQKGHVGPLPSLDDMEVELNRLKGMETKKGEHDGPAGITSGIKNRPEAVG